MAAQVLLQAAGFSLVGKQDDLAGFIVKRTGGEADAAAALEGNLVTIVHARGETLADDVAPELALQRFAKQFRGGRIAVAHLTMAVQHHHAAWQQLQQILQAAGDAFLFRYLG